MTTANVVTNNVVKTKVFSTILWTKMYKISILLQKSDQQVRQAVVLLIQTAYMCVMTFTPTGDNLEVDGTAGSRRGR